MMLVALTLAVTLACPVLAAGCDTFGEEMVPTGSSGAYTFKAVRNGDVFFKCNIGDHCSAGNMMLMVNVRDCPASPPAGGSNSSAAQPPPPPAGGNRSNSTLPPPPNATVLVNWTYSATRSMPEVMLRCNETLHIRWLEGTHNLFQDNNCRWLRAWGGYNSCMLRCKQTPGLMCLSSTMIHGLICPTHLTSLHVGIMLI